VTLRALLASYGNVRRAASQQGTSHPVKAAIFLSGPNIHQKISRDILSERMFVRGSKFDVFRQIFIIYMLKINFTHVALSGKS
jgi:hypothetical protein